MCPALWYRPWVVARSLPLLPVYVLYTVYTWLQMIRIFRVKTGSVMAGAESDADTLSWFCMNIFDPETIDIYYWICSYTVTGSVFCRDCRLFLGQCSFKIPHNIFPYLDRHWRQSPISKFSILCVQFQHNLPAQKKFPLPCSCTYIGNFCYTSLPIFGRWCAENHHSPP